MTAITSNKTWIKFIVVIFLVVLGITGIYYAYTFYLTSSIQEERNEIEVVPENTEKERL